MGGWVANPGRERLSSFAIPMFARVACRLSGSTDHRPQTTVVHHALVCLMLVGGLQGHEASSRLQPTPELLDEAVAWGLSGSAAPHPLRWYRTTAGCPDDGSPAMGWLYTPFVRVALAAAAAERDGRAPDRDELVRWLDDPLVYVAVQSMSRTGEDVDAVFEDVEPEVAVIRRGADGVGHPYLRPRANGRAALVASDGVTQGLAPHWVRPRWEGITEIDPDFDSRDIAVVAAFGRDVLRADLEIVSWKKGAGPLDKQWSARYRRGSIRDCDEMSWGRETSGSSGGW